MPPESNGLVEAIRSAIVAVATATAFERVAAAAEACGRLGSLTSGRWRSATRDLDRLEDEIERAMAQAGTDLEQSARRAGVEEEALWTAGEAAALRDLLVDDAIEELDEQDQDAVRLLEGEDIFGVALLDDDEHADRGTTLLFSWASPLQPAVWQWEATWITAEEGAADETADELEVFEVVALAADEAILARVEESLQVDAAAAHAALTAAARALTRASLLLVAGSDAGAEPNDDEGAAASENGHG